MIKYIFYLICFFICPLGAAAVHTEFVPQIRQEKNSLAFQLVVDDFSNWKTDFFSVSEKENDGPSISGYVFTRRKTPIRPA